MFRAKVPAQSGVRTSLLPQRAVGTWRRASWAANVAARWTKSVDCNALVHLNALRRFRGLQCASPSQPTQTKSALAHLRTQQGEDRHSNAMPANRGATGSRPSCRVLERTCARGPQRGWRVRHSCRKSWNTPMRRTAWEPRGPSQVEAHEVFGFCT